jgi:hypothetical protein
MKASKLTCAAGLVAYLAAGSAAAEEQTLRFRLVVSTPEVTFTEFAAAPGAMVGAGEAVGVAVFEDGRIAFKNFVVSEHGIGETGSANGYSTYTFQNGDSLTLSFTAGWTAEGVKGDYVLLSGTGAYEGAKGTGHFESVEEPWENADMFDGSFTLDVAAM